MDESRRAFLAGDRPDDVYIFLGESELADAEAAADRLAAHGERTANGVGIVVPGDQGRAAFSNAVGVDPMSFAGEAMGRDGAIARTLTNGDCPDAEADDGEPHAVRFLFAFVESRNEDAGGLYADGPVVHGYAACTCGTTYSERWLATDPESTAGPEEST